MFGQRSKLAHQSLRAKQLVSCGKLVALLCLQREREDDVKQYWLLFFNALTGATLICIGNEKLKYLRVNYYVLVKVHLDLPGNFSLHASGYSPFSSFS